MTDIYGRTVNGSNRQIPRIRSPLGHDSSVGTATRYGLDGPLEARFSVSVQTVPGVHPASCTDGYKANPMCKSAGAWP